MRENVTVKAVSAADFPLQLGSFIEILSQLGQINPNLKQISKVLAQLQLNSNRFPVKLTIPLDYTLELRVDFCDFKFTAPAKGLFQSLQQQNQYFQ